MTTSGKHTGIVKNLDCDAANRVLLKPTYPEALDTPLSLPVTPKVVHYRLR